MKENIFHVYSGPAAYCAYQAHIRVLKARHMNTCGQALVETLLTTVFLTIVVFAALQLIVNILNDLTVNEAVFAVSRVVIVSKSNEVHTKTKLAAGYLFASYIDPKNMPLLPYDIPVETDRTESCHKRFDRNNELEVYHTSIKFFQSIMFSTILNRHKGKGTTGNTTHVRMIKSPNEEHYDNAFPQAPNF